MDCKFVALANNFESLNYNLKATTWLKNKGKVLTAMYKESFKKVAIHWVQK